MHQLHGKENHPRRFALHGEAIRHYSQCIATDKLPFRIWREREAALYSPIQLTKELVNRFLQQWHVPAL